MNLKGCCCFKYGFMTFPNTISQNCIKWMDIWENDEGSRSSYRGSCSSSRDHITAEMLQDLDYFSLFWSLSSSEMASSINLRIQSLLLPLAYLILILRQSFKSRLYKYLAPWLQLGETNYPSNLPPNFNYLYQTEIWQRYYIKANLGSLTQSHTNLFDLPNERLQGSTSGHFKW